VSAGEFRWVQVSLSKHDSGGFPAKCRKIEVSSGN